MAPTGPVGTTTFVFSSGIRIAPAVGRQRTLQAAGSAVQSCWGAPALPSGPDAPIGSVVQEVPRLDTEVPHPGQDPATMAVALALGHDAPLSAPPSGLRRLVSQAEMPFLDRFDVVDCGGDGDWLLQLVAAAYTIIAPL